ncbi:MAG: PhoH family protein [Flavobacteriales bacterium]
MLENEKIAIAPLAYIRGRSLSNIFFIVDEAQNLTPLEVKTVIDRAGRRHQDASSPVMYQIDTPYLDAESNGLSYLIDKAKGDPLFAHVTLEKGERSALANLANALLYSCAARCGAGLRRILLLDEREVQVEQVL